jgi:large subunit ribosomal protein L5
MRQIKIEKVTLNVGCGGVPEKIEKAKKFLEKLTGQKAVITLSKRRSTFGVAKGKPIGVRVTLRGKAAARFLKLALAAVDKRVSSTQFDKEGNFSIGIKEYIDLPGVKYDHTIGMLGLDVVVTLERPGFRIKRRRIQRKRIPVKHRITREEAMEWLKSTYKAKIV